MDTSSIASKRFAEGFSCSQAVFAAFADRLSLDTDDALKIAAGFGGGMGRMGLTCGAVTGAFMAIGLKHGAVSAGDREAKAETYRLIREFADRFASRNGSICCRELLGYDIGTDEGYAQARQAGAFVDVCSHLVEDAARILEEML